MPHTRACTHHIDYVHFFSFGETFFTFGATFFFLARLSFLARLFFLAQLFLLTHLFNGATIFLFDKTFSSGTTVSSFVLICRPLLDLLRAQTRVAEQESKIAGGTCGNNREKVIIYSVLNTFVFMNGWMEGR